MDCVSEFLWCQNLSVMTLPGSGRTSSYCGWQGVLQAHLLSYL